MTGEGARLTVHFGERGRSGGVPVAERIMTAFGDAGLASAVILRGGEGFGPGQGLRTSGQLSLSEDLPMVAIAVDKVERIGPAARKVRVLLEEGLVTVESVQATPSSVPGGLVPALHPGTQGSHDSRFAVWIARHVRIAGRSAHARLVDSLRDQGMKAALALPGVDGLAGGVRHRAGFFSANRSVPMLVTGVGSAEAMASARDTVAELLPDALFEILPHGLFSAARVSKAGPADLCRLAVFGDGALPGTGIHGQREIVRMLRADGAAGATAYFGHYGFVGDESPHGDSMRSLRRRVPVLTEVIDSPENCRRWLRAIKDMDDGSLVKTLSPVELISRPAGQA